ncbi:SH3 domain-containing protein [Candidatus Peregrinibacteria bacterium]|nr:SH3 domain-containing protein [Candidatus Peregrinibacteria bacterium]
MTPRRYRPASRGSSARPLIAFLLIASFGILFAGCSRSGIRGPEDIADEFTFTEDDVARFRELATSSSPASAPAAKTKTGATMELNVNDASSVSTLPTTAPEIDLSRAKTYEAIRSGPSGAGKNLYRVTNEFLNVRDQANITSGNLGRLDRGAIVTMVDFTNAAWATVEYAPGKQGYVALRYLSKLTTEDKLAEEKKAFDGQYFVNFGFVNVRKDPNAQSEKLGELPGQQIVKPISKDDVWARIPFSGREGYVAMQYLSPFVPNFLVRQEKFTLPILHYNMAEDDMQKALVAHVAKLRAEGIRLLTMRDFYDLLLVQEQRDVRLEPKTVVIALTNITPKNVDAVSSLLSQNNIRATLFLETQHLGLTGIPEKKVLTLLANGMDLQSAGHTGDDLRSLTNAQVELELKQSRSILEDLTKKTVFAVAYPQGGVNDRVMQKAIEAGYLLGLGSAPERTFGRGQLLRLPSFTITASMQEDDVLQIVRPEQ